MIRDGGERFLGDDPDVLRIRQGRGRDCSQPVHRQGARVVEDLGDDFRLEIFELKTVLLAKPAQFAE
jgi:hypothetical protein